MFGDVGKNAKHFAIKPMGDICEVTSSHRVFTTEFVKEGIPFYRVKRLGNWLLELSLKTLFIFRNGVMNSCLPTIQSQKSVTS